MKAMLKPRVFEILSTDGLKAYEIINFCEGKAELVTVDWEDVIELSIYDDYGTVSGTVIVQQGDYLVKTKRGKIFSCSPLDFKNFFEVVES